MTRPPTLRNRRFVLAALAVSPFSALAQSRTRLRVACPGGDSRDYFLQRIESGLARAGVKEAEVRCFHAPEGRGLKQSVDDALAWQPDVIFVGGPLMAQLARDATRSVPVVFFAVPEPEEFDLVKSLARPGGNVTGVASSPAEVVLKRMELGRELLPGARRLAAFYRDPRRGRLLESVRSKVLEAGPRLGFTVEEFEVGAGGGFRATLAQLSKNPTDAVLPFGPIGWEPGGGQVDPTRAFVDYERRHRSLVLHDGEDAVRSGATVAAFDGGSQLDSAVAVVARVLKGESPAVIPVEMPRTFRIGVNKGAARAIGISIPPSVLLRADPLIE